MSKHTRSHQPQPTPSATPMPRKPEPPRHDTTGTPRPAAAAKISDAKSQAKPMAPAAPQRRLTSGEEFQLIQMRAYCLWEQAGRPGGDAPRELFWFLAESEVTVQQPGV